MDAGDDEPGNTEGQRTRVRGSMYSAMDAKQCPIAIASSSWPVQACIGSKCALWSTDKTRQREGQNMGRCSIGGDIFKDPATTSEHP